MASNGIPFMEFYRPTHFDNIVLDPLNRQIFKNIIETCYFPNLLFYGPPGTGKTTTVINLINSYQSRINGKNKDLIIHLNASDERGIDIIRNQINNFVNSNPLFNKGAKFVILDEVDYMTKNAQQALRYLLQNYNNNNVKFCLICNYISKIDEGLQTEFITLRFNQLPREEIITLLNNISTHENLNLSPTTLSSIQQLYKSDIRSMINFIQSNQNIENEPLNIIDAAVYDTILSKIAKPIKIEYISNYMNDISIKYNIDKKNIIKDLLNYIIKTYPMYVTSEFLDFAENLVHSQNQNGNIHVNYLIAKLTNFIR
jgi:DNA polymerase III delta prime subunit